MRLTLFALEFAVVGFVLVTASVVFIRQIRRGNEERDRELEKQRAERELEYLRERERRDREDWDRRFGEES